MEISSKVWHLRWIRFLTGQEYTPGSLCPYFWTVVAFIVFAVPLLIFKCLACVDKWLDRRSTWHKSEAMSGHAGLRLFYGVMFGVITLPLWALVLFGIYCRGFFPERPPGEKAKVKVKQPSILIEWTRAKKRRVCPMIKVREE